jgi:hypothetical protein
MLLKLTPALIKWGHLVRRGKFCESKHHINLHADILK